MSYSIDATREPVEGPRLGRLLNHADKTKERNCKPKVVEYNGKPRLCIFSTRYVDCKFVLCLRSEGAGGIMFSDFSFTR